jgi:hypothetical protein
VSSALSSVLVHIVYESGQADLTHLATIYCIGKIEFEGRGWEGDGVADVRRFFFLDTRAWICKCGFGDEGARGQLRRWSYVLVRGLVLWFWICAVGRLGWRESRNSNRCFGSFFFEEFRIRRMPWCVIREIAV